MRKYIFVAIGGLLGAISRFSIKNIYLLDYHGYIPLNTLIINLSGSFLLALFLTIAFEVWEFDSDIRLGITTGFLGAYTTFSTLCRETVQLIIGGHCSYAALYLILSTLLGLMFAYLGVTTAREIIGRLVERTDGSE